MHSDSIRHLVRRLPAALAFSLVTSAVFAQAARDSSPLVVDPARRAADSRPGPPPAVPVSLDRIPALTLQVTVRRDVGGRALPAVNQVVSRTADRVLVVAGDRREWLFERNPVDPRRASATLVDHADRTIVLYDETGLRMALGIRGWLDVVTLGFDASTLDAASKRADTPRIDGIEFTSYGAGSTGQSRVETWWNESIGLPARYTVSAEGATTRLTVDRITHGVAAAALAPAVSRYPTYRTIDVTDWLEKH